MDAAVSGREQGGRRMTESVRQAIDKLLDKGHRVELIPGPNGSVKVIRIERAVALDTKK